MCVLGMVKLRLEETVRAVRRSQVGEGSSIRIQPTRPGRLRREVMEVLPVG